MSNNGHLIDGKKVIQLGDAEIERKVASTGGMKEKGR